MFTHPLAYQPYGIWSVCSEKTLSCPLLNKHSIFSVYFPFLKSAYLYRKAEGSKSNVQTLSNTLHLTKIKVFRGFHLMAKHKNCKETKILTWFNVWVQRAGFKTLRGRSLPMLALGHGELREWRASGLIFPSSSPLGAVFLFVKKNDSTLLPCIDCCCGMRHLHRSIWQGFSQS